MVSRIDLAGDQNISKLGGLGTHYGQRWIDLVPGDVLVWLSDGLIEATDGDARPFGYPGVIAAIGDGGSEADGAGAVRDRLLSAVEKHTGGRPVEDDLTVVVMRYQPGGEQETIFVQDTVAREPHEPPEVRAAS